MIAVEWIVGWGVVAILSAIIGGIVAAYKRRDASAWAAWCFLFPPALIVVALLSTNPGPRPRRPSFDQDDLSAG